ncbi:hypothetical protein MHSWG343_05330 [Candidatus Mycoplasma haematohominis]|uniref:Uncharacterized protein n=1 Tax=Candidatus Mycoplasma haematohominis TaxID=1494318 RepID=A0A478FT26_9MOLU|nr:hypothetical protein MHSWG343_05330 [Candidatus Mycoplasma haemohominis]
MNLTALRLNTDFLEAKWGLGMLSFLLLPPAIYFCVKNEFWGSKIYRGVSRVSAINFSTPKGSDSSLPTLLAKPTSVYSKYKNVILQPIERSKTNQQEFDQLFPKWQEKLDFLKQNYESKYKDVSDTFRHISNQTDGAVLLAGQCWYSFASDTAVQENNNNNWQVAHKEQLGLAQISSSDVEDKTDKFWNAMWDLCSDWGTSKEPITKPEDWGKVN